MFAQSSSPQMSKFLVDELLATLGALPTAALLKTPKVHLLMAAVLLNENTKVADLTPNEATYTGYTAGGIALPAPGGPYELNPAVDGNLYTVVFSVAAPGTVTNTIYGYWIDGNVGVEMYQSEIFATPYPMVLVGDFLQVNLLIGVVKTPTVS
jgi:hypothetical protein